MRLMDINKIDEDDFGFSITLHMTFYWFDNRIKFDENSSDITTANVDISFLNEIWIPDFYIYDLNYFRELESFRIQGGLSVNKNDSNTG